MSFRSSSVRSTPGAVILKPALPLRRTTSDTQASGGQMLRFWSKKPKCAGKFLVQNRESTVQVDVSPPIWMPMCTSSWRGSTSAQPELASTPLMTRRPVIGLRFVGVNLMDVTVRSSQGSVVVVGDTEVEVDVKVVDVVDGALVDEVVDEVELDDVVVDDVEVDEVEVEVVEVDDVVVDVDVVEVVVEVVVVVVVVGAVVVEVVVVVVGAAGAEGAVRVDGVVAWAV